MCRLTPILLVSCFATLAKADEFDNLDGATLAAMARDPSTVARERMTISEIGNLPPILRGPRAALIVATTEQGNPCRLLVSAGLRKPPGGKGEAVPVLVLERFDTFEAGNLKNRLARGRDLLLFDGFQIDLDFGQVVPEGQGGDLQFLATGEGGPRLVPVAGAKLATPTKLPKADPAAAASKPSTGRTVLPGDFAGRFRVFANGQWSGTLDLKVEAKGVVAGRFRSDQTGTSYPVKGQVSTNPPNKVEFAIELPRTRQEFEALMWVEGKGAMAGTMTMLDRPFGFFALREGGTYAPDGEEVGPSPDRTFPGRLTVLVKPGGAYSIDGKDLDEAAFSKALKEAVGREEGATVALKIPGDLPFFEVQKAIEAARSAGIDSVRLAPSVEAPAKE